ncbi:ABC transporter permease [Streptantibioticus cattleyicolor]|uniref:Transport permease protein n=1 Tax=Streptantibioticus cattleyicolor (strain ATCC 35852 / DSM 46488 / JCM 4925 / NBRC 14057 / NRRL 8057) TaxID=1003195 RepID=F8JJL6_STREN|nr:ABC transporter permease [Streptantibioticus cattleyicolor]AEW99938.1 ABC-2 type transporter [Streptantibioticus cattleyicolor NRRL 8057 = DSM 46488]CCB71030.1 Putative drug resistance ABC transporter, permease subunit; putative daunorubicin/doxorubicin resistance ABC transporter permease protein drrB [Streptantibioticus cattleyicolor NRRL 8057 = DSM 46488]
MTTPTPPRPAPPRPATHQRKALRRFRTWRYLRETALLVSRTLRVAARMPVRIGGVTLQPVVNTVLFVTVFGSAVHIPATRYPDYLLPGLIAQSVAFGGVSAGVATATDFSLGVIDRLTSLPITRLAVITAQIVGQVIEQAASMLVVACLGAALGWRPRVNADAICELAGLLLLGLFAFTTFGVLLGTIVRTPATIQGLGYGILLPLVFLGGTYVPVTGMQTLPRTIAEYNPIAALVAAVRQVAQGTGSTGSLMLEHPVPSTAACCTLLIAVCLPLAVKKFGPGP